MTRHPIDPVSLVLGILATIAGIALLTDLGPPTFGALFRGVVDWWPILLVVVGIWLIAASQRRRSGAPAAVSAETAVTGAEEAAAPGKATEPEELAGPHQAASVPAGIDTATRPDEPHGARPDQPDEPDEARTDPPDEARPGEPEGSGEPRRDD
ncbi:hypothetical protein ER308_16855 [Egibacter rhizosphaerae]|uniref:DUF5668 domain-containing protein n=1 Tax=Egibacter rhizosphaerae TaxID=1670831 RepID=A0A411YIQ2_9ACTN|nr:hypothetical protein [Egibacter rhizosphaerae]QBI21077.1 hypothetical protein ER308_16855 [Egibacter rhizosphaerae]